MSSNQLDRDGSARCISCREVKKFEELRDNCACCEKWVCKTCAIKLPSNAGYACVACYKKVNSK